MPVRKHHFLAAAFGLVVIFIIFLTCEQSRRPAPRYRVTDLGVLPGYTYSEAVAVNSKGDVLLSNSASGSYLEHACQYRGGKLYDLGTLPGATETKASGINSLGDTTGNAVITSVPHAFVYRNGKMQDLGTLHGFPYSKGAGINDRGEIAGNLIDYGAPPGQPQSHVFLVRNGKMSDLGIPPGCSVIYATSINTAGNIFGYCQRTPAFGGKRHPFVYDSRTGKVTVLALTAPYINSLFLQGNDTGQIVGSAASSNDVHPALWNGNKITDMGAPAGYEGGFGRGLNNRGQAVGFCFRDDNLSIVRNIMHKILHLPERESEHAFVYQKGKIQDLNELIAGDADWTLEEARSINDSGQIVGRGRHHGQVRAFLLTPVR